MRNMSTFRPALTAACAAALAAGLFSCTTVRDLAQEEPMAPAPVPDAREPGHLIAPEGYAVLAHLVGDEHQGRNTFTDTARPVPADNYRLAACVVETRDANGDAWRLHGVGHPRETVAEVRPGETARLTIGEPLRARLTAVRRGPDVVFSLHLRGAGGETYDPAIITRNGRRAEAPGIVIRDERGDVVARGRFRYG